MRVIGLLIFSLFVAVIVRAQTPFTKEFWLNESNISIKVNDLIYETGGYLWLASDNGVYRFNGRNFTLISDSLHQPVISLTMANGSIYAGYKNGKIGVVKNDAIALIKIRNKFPSSAITSLHARGQMLFATTEEEGVFLIINNTGWQLTSQRGLADNFIYDAMITRDGLMVTTDRGINNIKWDGKNFSVKAFTTAQGLPDNIVRVLKPIPSSKLCWIGTQEGGLALYDDNDKTIHSFKVPHVWAWGQVNDILPVNNDEAWIATDEGYLLHVKKIGDSLDVVPYTYEGVKLNKLAIDQTGNIWCATNKGLMMNTALYATQIQLSSYHLNKITTVICDRGNNIWYSQNRELYKLSPSNLNHPELILTAAASISCLYFDINDNLWIGSFGKGLFRYANKKLTPVKSIAELINGHILSIAAIKNNLWIASLNGVEETIINDSSGLLKQFKHHNKLSGIGSDYIYQLYPDKKGRMWMATDGGGICMYDGIKYHRWDSANGLTSQVAYTIAEDVFGNIWAGTLEKGLFFFQGKQWVQIKQNEGLQNLNITSIIANATGQVIIVNQDGIDQWYPKDRQFKHYNRRLGINIDSTSAILNCITKDTAGNVCVPFEHGFVFFNNLSNNYSIIPGVRINMVSLFFKPLHKEQHEFLHNQNHISFRYEGINFSNPERLHYRYRLKGYDENWIYTNDEVVPFPQLPPGKYKFLVQASLNSSFNKAAEASYNFIVIKPFWQRTGFIILFILFLFGIAYIIIRVRERGIRKLSKLQKERMVFEYEHLKSQVNPHFLFNSLNTLVNLIEDDKKAAVDYTIHLADLYHNMLSYKDQDIILLSEEYEIITNYMYIQKSRFGAALQLQATISDEVLKTKKIVPLALQLLVENAIKHNVVSLSIPLTIYITANENEITVSNIIQPKMSKEKGAGLGLVNIKTRYKLITKRSMKFRIEDNQYIVTLPLL